MTHSLPWNMAIEIVNFPIIDGDFPVRYVNVYHGVKALGFSGQRHSKQLKLQSQAAAFQFHCAKLSSKGDRTTHGAATCPAIAGDLGSYPLVV